MVFPLLPTSAAPFADRKDTIVILGPTVNRWLTKVLRQAKITDRLRQDVSKQRQCLVKLLSSSHAIWTLAFLEVDQAPTPGVRDDPQGASSNCQKIHIQAHIIHIDMVYRNEVSYKLTDGTIETLVECYEKILSAQAETHTTDLPEKEKQSKALLEEFVKNINKYIYRANVEVLNHLKEYGIGELGKDKAPQVKKAIRGLMKSWMPPPPAAPPVPAEYVVRQRRLRPLLPRNYDVGSQATVTSATATFDTRYTIQESPIVMTTSPGITPTRTDIVTIQNVDDYPSIPTATPACPESVQPYTHEDVISYSLPMPYGSSDNSGGIFQGYDVLVMPKEVALSDVVYPEYHAGIGPQPEPNHLAEYRWPSQYRR